MPDDDTIKFECLHCKQSIEAPGEMDGTIVECPSCGKKVKVFKTLNIPLASLELPKQPEDDESEYEHVRDIAGSFATVGVWLTIGAILLVGFCVSAGSGWVTSLYAGSAAAGLGAWCYLLAQIIYIRAALEKQD